MLTFRLKYNFKNLWILISKKKKKNNKEGNDYTIKTA